MRWLAIVLFMIGCSKTADNKDTKGASPGPTAGSGAYLTVGAYCTSFCTKLCDTCGQGDCPTSCNKRCQYGRSPDKVLDGSDPKTGLALTQANLDACVATITKESCMSIASGQVPPVCFTIQH